MSIGNKKTSLYYIVTFMLFLIFTVGAFLFIKKYFGGDISPGRLFRITSVRNGALLLLVFTLFILTDSLRLYYIMRVMGGRLGFPFLVKLSCINIFVSNITPMATGGGFMQIYLLHKKGLAVSLATAITSLRTLMTIIFFIFIFPLAMVFLPVSREFLLSRGNGSYFSLVIIAYLVFLFVVSQIFINQKKVTRIIVKLLSVILYKFRIRRGEEIIHKAEQAVSHFFGYVNVFLLKKKKEVVVAMLLTLLYLCVIFMVPAVLILNYTQEPPVLDVFVNQIIVSFFTYFAFTPGASGFAELIFAFFNANLIGRENLLSFTFMWRFAMIYLGMALGAVFTFFEFIPLRSKN